MSFPPSAYTFPFPVQILLLSLWEASYPKITESLYPKKLNYIAITLFPLLPFDVLLCNLENLTVVLKIFFIFYVCFG